MGEADDLRQDGEMGPGTEAYSGLVQEAQSEIPQPYVDSDRERIFEEHGPEISSGELDDMAEARRINADALFADGKPDKAEAEGALADHFRAQAESLRNGSES